MFRRIVVVATGLALLGLQVAGAATARAATVGADVNVTRMGGNQSEASIAIDPVDPNHVVELSNREGGGGLVLSVSDDGGLTWTPSDFARNDQLGTACCDPTISWDSFGNLFLSWLWFHPNDPSSIPVALSVDGGHTFTLLKVLHPRAPTSRATGLSAALRMSDDPDSHGAHSSLDQPTIVTGPGAVWVDWTNGSMQATGAPVTGLGKVGAFVKREDIPKTGRCTFGDISVGPTGQVFVVCTKDKAGTAPVVDSIRAATDPDGFGPLGFTAAKVIGTTNVQLYDYITPQRNRSVDAETGLAWDTVASSPHLGRLYLIWTDEQPNQSSDTDVWLRYSDDSGTTWSTPTRVNDVTTNAQFLPRIALDPTTGNLAIGWHDARNDLGDHGPGDTDGKPNTDAMYYLTFSTDGGLTFAPSVQVATGVSNSRDAHNGIDYGDYTGLSFYAGVATPAWSDNSNSTGDNPAGVLHSFDIYTARVSLI
jgi:hypothetical protein